MHGTLEVKQEALTADAVQRPEWMDEVAADAMTECQRKVWRRTLLNGYAVGHSAGASFCTAVCSKRT